MGIAAAYQIENNIRIVHKNRIFHHQAEGKRRRMLT